jgi:hypothetical protein
MNHTNSFFHHASSTHWQLLGKLELTVDPDTDHTVGKWLAVILNGLNLHADFMNKVLKSAQETTARVMHAEAVIRFRHIHLLVYAPPDHAPHRHNWGFFRIDKIKNPSDQDYPNHAIEFYLYQDE